VDIGSARRTALGLTVRKIRFPLGVASELIAGLLELA
jgi:hypothetical protein